MKYCDDCKKACKQLNLKKRNKIFWICNSCYFSNTSQESGTQKMDTASLNRTGKTH